MSYEFLGKEPVTEATISFMDVARDPYLREFACEIHRLDNVTTYGRPGPPCTRTKKRPKSPSEVGLRELLPALRAFTFHQQYPYAIPMAAFAVLSLVYTVGFLKGTRK